MFEPRLVPTIRKRVTSSDGDDIESKIRRIDVNLGNNHALKQCNKVKSNIIGGKQLVGSEYF